MLMFDLSRETVERILHDASPEKNTHTVNTTSTDGRSEEIVFCVQRNHSKCLDLASQNSYAMLSWKTKHSYSFTEPKTNQPVRCGQVKRPAGLWTDFQSHQIFVSSYLISNDPVTIDILQEKTAHIATCYV